MKCVTMSKRRNERKLEVLEYVADAGAVTSNDLANALDLEVHNARMLLLNYHRQGLLTRCSFHGLCKIYEITVKGLDRIKWLKERVAVAE